MSDEAMLADLTNIMRDTLKGAQDIPIVTMTTTAQDVPGWDSLSHAMLMLNIESEYDIELPLEKTLDMRNVGDLVELIQSTKIEVDARA